jgi:hypothetical protein
LRADQKIFSSGIDLQVPPLTLARDLGNLVGSPIFADIKFVTGDHHTLFAHRFILESRSEYFRMVFGTNSTEEFGKMQTAQAVEDAGFGVVSVSVPGFFSL